MVWRRAGQRSVERSAYLEATRHLERGLDLLKTVPDGRERKNHKLNLLMTLGPVLAATKGHAAPEVEHTFARARELSEEIGDTARLFQVTHGYWLAQNVQGNLRKARELGDQLRVGGGCFIKFACCIVSI